MLEPLAALGDPADPIATNHVGQLTGQEVVEFEQTGATVVDNEEGLIAFDVSDGTTTERIAVYDAVTAGGTPVVAMAILEESEIEEFEAHDGEHSGWLGPPGVSAHVTNFNHYHYFWNGSYVYQYANSYNVYVYLSPQNATTVRWVGNAVAAAIGIIARSPLLGLVGVIAWNYGVDYYDNADGSITFYVPTDSVINWFGNVFWYGSQQAWYWFYSSSSSLYCYARKTATGQLYYVCP